MKRYVLVFAICVAGMFASQTGVLPKPSSWSLDLSWPWSSRVEIEGNFSSQDLKEIKRAAKSYAGGERKPLVAIREIKGTNQVYAVFQGKQYEVEGTGGMMCGSGTTYTLTKKNGKWKVVDQSSWFG